jgi:hypothetical protein
MLWLITYKVVSITHQLILDRRDHKLTWSASSSRIIDHPDQRRTLINDLQEGPQQTSIGENEPDRRLVERMLQTLRSERRISCGKWMAHPSQTVAHDLPVHARLRIHPDSFLPIFIPPAVPPESQMTHTRGGSTDALVQLVIGVRLRFGHCKAKEQAKGLIE